VALDPRHITPLVGIDVTKTAGKLFTIIVILVFELSISLVL
jgi:hypothetical protein